METEIKFKFQPAWITIISLFTLSILYKFYSFAANVASLNFSVVLVAIIPIFLSWLIFPKTIKMLRGIPAMLLTKDYLVDNLGNHLIRWGDISEIRLIESRYRSFSKLIINLKQPEKYFDTPIKQLLYRFRQLFIVNDIGIIIDFVSGDREEIMRTIQVYWGKYSASK